MKRAVTIACLFIGATVTASSSSAGRSPQQAKDVLMRCIKAMGGIDRLRNVEAISYQSFEHTFVHAVDISESLPEMVAYTSYDVVFQPQRQNLNIKFNWRTTESASQGSSVVTATPEGGFTEEGEKRRAFNGDRFYGVIDILAANPLTALLGALDSPDLNLARQPDGTYAISFRQSVYGQPVKTTLGIGKTSALLEWLQIEHSYDHDAFAAIWGKTTKKLVFSAWCIDPSGVYFPTKWKVITNGVVEGQQSLFNLKLNSEIPASTFEIPQEFKDSFSRALSGSTDDLAKANHGQGDHLDVAEGVVMLPGKQHAYNSLVVKQNNGIVIIEGPFSNTNSEYVIDYARKLFPRAPITSLLSTNQLWFHVAGLAAYAQIHTPIYALDSNAELVRRVVAAQAGAGQVSPAAPQLRTVRDRTEIGTGVNRIILIPFRGAASARMMAAYFPELRLLYCSDMYLPQNWAGVYWTEHLAEIRDLIDREHIDVQRVLGVSMLPRDWKELSAAIPAGQPVRKSIGHRGAGRNPTTSPIFLPE